MKRYKVSQLLLASPVLLGVASLNLSASATPLNPFNNPPSEQQQATQNWEQQPLGDGVSPPATPANPAVSPAIAQTTSLPLADPILPASELLSPTTSLEARSPAMSQVTSVSQLSDVQPTDWAFQALQSLVERYGCIAGYPDGTYRGNRALTRYEFAAGLNACLDQINRLIAGATANAIGKEDLTIIQRLQEEFAAELATLKGRVDALESRTAELEANQFSTTTKLVGESIWLVGDSFGNRLNTEEDETETFLAHRTRLDFQTSFGGRDLLTTRLQINNIPNLANTTGTNMARIGPDSTPSNDIVLDRLFYRFPVGRATFFIGARGLALDTIAPTINPLDNAGVGVVSRFGLRNPTIYRSSSGTGAAVTYRFSNSFRAHLGYVADDNQASNPETGNGLFNGSYATIAQLTWSLKQLELGLTYTHKYFTNDNVNVTSGTGSGLANRPFGQNATTSDNFGIQANWKLSRGFQLGGWFGYTLAHQQRNGDSEATILNGAVTLAFPDLFAAGNLGGILIGIPPKVTSNDFKAKGKRQEDKDTSLHIEAFYRFRVNDFVNVTPIVYVITNPEHNADNDPIWVGVLRTTFLF